MIQRHGERRRVDEKDERDRRGLGNIENLVVSSLRLANVSVSFLSLESREVNEAVREVEGKAAGGEKESKRWKKEFFLRKNETVFLSLQKKKKTRFNNLVVIETLPLLAELGENRNALGGRTRNGASRNGSDGRGAGRDPRADLGERNRLRRENRLARNYRLHGGPGLDDERRHGPNAERFARQLDQQRSERRDRGSRRCGAHDSRLLELHRLPLDLGLRPLQ